MLSNCVASSSCIGTFRVVPIKFRDSRLHPSLAVHDGGRRCSSCRVCGGNSTGPPSTSRILAPPFFLNPNPLNPTPMAQPLIDSRATECPSTSPAWEAWGCSPRKLRICGCRALVWCSRFLKGCDSQGLFGASASGLKRPKAFAPKQEAYIRRL